MFIHESSFVDLEVLIGEARKVLYFSQIMRRAKIGRYCNIGQNVFIDPDVVIGDSVRIMNNVSIDMGVILEDDAFLGSCIVFTNVEN